MKRIVLITSRCWKTYKSSISSVQPACLLESSLYRFTHLLQVTPNTFRAFLLKSLHIRNRGPIAYPMHVEYLLYLIFFLVQGQKLLFLLRPGRSARFLSLVASDRVPMTGRKRKYLYPVSITLSLLACLTAPSYAQTARSYVVKDTVSIGERFELILALDGATSSNVQFLPSNAEPSLFGDLEVLSRSEMGVLELNGIRTDSVIYEVATFAIDTAFVPALPAFITSGADTLLFASTPFMIPVRSIVPEDAQNIRDLAPLAEFPRRIWPWLLLLLALAAVGYFYYQRRAAAPEPEPEPVVITPPKPQISPYDLAMQELTKLQKEWNLNDQAHIKPFYDGLSDILRTYLFGKLRVPALEMTTRETLYHLERRITGKLIPRQVARLTRRILDVSDLVKFADMEPPAQVGEQAITEIKTLLDIVEQAMKAGQKPERVPPTQPQGQEATPPPTPAIEADAAHQENTPSSSAES